MAVMEHPQYVTFLSGNNNIIAWLPTAKIGGRRKKVAPGAVPEQGHTSVSWQRRSLHWHSQCGSRGTRGQGRGRRRGGTSPVPPECSAGLGGEGKEVEEREKVG